MKTLILYLVLTGQTTQIKLAHLRGELRSWDKQYTEMVKLRPRGIYDRTQYNNSFLYYRVRSVEILNEINNLNEPK